MKAPRGRAQIIEFYGDPALWTREDGTPHPSWDSLMVTVPFPSPLPLGWDKSQFATRARVHRAIAPTVEITFAALKDKNVWRHLRTYDGGYTWRSKRGSKKMSMHAFGGALDFDAATNSLGDLDFDMSEDVVRVFRSLGWTWGGQWSRPDAMHYQWGRSY